MSGGSKMAVQAAIAANIVVTIAKLTGFALTGSGAMLSEGIHSIADVGNQLLLAVGMNRSQRPADDFHPGGYGREAFVWALISAVGIFFLGCGVTIMHGIDSLQHPEIHESGGMMNVGILLFALVAEGSTLTIAIREIYHAAAHRNMRFSEYLKATDDPFTVAVLLEDSAAVTGVLIALSAVVATHYTHNPYFDAVGSLMIGALLGLVAVFLIWKNTNLLVGKSVHEDQQQHIRSILESEPAVEQIIHQSAVVTGASSFRLSAELDFDGRYFAREYLKTADIAAIQARMKDEPSLRSFLEEFGEHIVEAVGDEVDRIEGRLQEQLPEAGFIALEPD